MLWLELTRSLWLHRDVSVQTVDVSSATRLHSTDDLSNVTKNQRKSWTQLVVFQLVDNFVSIKMPPMMQSLVESSVDEYSNCKANQVEPFTATANVTNTTIKPDSDFICQLSPSSSSLSILAASHSVDAYDSMMSSLLDKLKTIRPEASCREQKEKEDLLAMRQLHSAEVDALRRKLSYLESRILSLGRWDLNNGGASASGRWILVEGFWG